ncbi:hypothetical protein CVT24_005446 [Panaeolus cyanescens]|uniref:DUF6729 domain-containing protein n=1 Tax=Panaeolus cyanescens TaxID=181874 RepID=A0A409YC61_9AGAR|nr:hypothetical protein CVT24_005446 [Panaeolus cyanescens]
MPANLAILSDPTKNTCPSFEDEEYSAIRQALIAGHQGPDAMTDEAAVAKLKETWTNSNARKIEAWNQQEAQRKEREAEEERAAQEAAAAEQERKRMEKEAEDEAERKAAEKKKPKINSFDANKSISSYIEPRPSSFAINKLDNLGYVELDYFTDRGCRQAQEEVEQASHNTTFGLTSLGGNGASDSGGLGLQPLSSLRPLKGIRRDQDLSWSETVSAKNTMISWMFKSKAWPEQHVQCTAKFFWALENHPIRKTSALGDRIVVVYGARARREWFDALERNEGFNLALIDESLMRSIADEVLEAARRAETEAVKRSVGRPRGSGKQKAVVETGPKRPPGRPRGSGKRKRADSEQDSDDLGVLQVKRGPGRPPKNVLGRVSVINLQGQKIRVAGNGRYNQAFMLEGSSSRSGSGLSNSSITSRQRSPLPTNVFSVHPRPTLPLPRTQAQAPQTTLPTHIEAEVVPLEPGEDPQHFVCDVDGHDVDEDVDDDDGDGSHCLENEASGEGIGVNEERPSGDEEEDEVDPDDALQDNPLSNESQKREPRAPWLLVVFNSLSAEARKRTTKGVPLLYTETQSFWFVHKSAYLILRAAGFPIPQLLYNPRFFLWDPLALETVPCPYCKTPLVRHGQISYPRQVVDFDSPFWIIGFRYRCPSCRHAKSNQHTVTFQSWDSRIIKVLSPPLAAEFPAELSWRSGMSRSLAEWMRSCFQAGMGAKQFTDVILAQHTLYHDKRRLQYLHTIVPRTLSTWIQNQKFAACLPYDDRSPEGFHGFVPSASWFRMIYDRMIEEHQSEILQHTAMLPLNVGAIDHSFKFSKQLARAKHEPVFPGLLTITNENGEIRTCHLVTTTGHSQSEPILMSATESLDMYGHPQPSAMYTDNISGDKALLEDAFNSALTQDVISVGEKYTHLEKLEIPPEVSVLVMKTVPQIDEVCKSILDDVLRGGEPVAIGFDSEWNVDYLANDRIRHQGPTALVQFAYRNAVGDMIAEGYLPSQLRAVLESPKVLKVGRMIDTDVANLRATGGITGPLHGIVDLAKLAKQRCVINSIRTTSLADLVARVLHRQLVKNSSEKISNTLF